MPYNVGMTLEEIKQEMDARDMNITSLAKELGITADGLGRVLSGKRPLTEQLARHISYVLGKRESILVYRVQASEKKVEELTAGKGCKGDKERVEAIIAYNMQQLAELGAQASWTAEQRAAWGLEPSRTPAAAPYAEEKRPFA